MKNDVLLQAFHWQSPETILHPGGRSWYQIIKENTKRIKKSGFTMAWFPPVSDSTEKHGYEPRELNKYDSAYGSEEELKSAIKSIRPVGAIADIVINHRSGKTNYSDFKNPDWPPNTIVSNDEYSGEKSINTDSGEHAKFSRDLDHKNGIVSNGISAWMNGLKKDLGFKGWRYDFVKGYAPWANALYNARTKPEFSVGEFFDYEVQPIVNWIDGSHDDPAYRSTAFDFPLRKALHEAITWRNYHHLKVHDKAPGLLGIWSDKAVTFLENHDTEEVRQGQYVAPFKDGDQMLQGYAYLLTHPGIPCVFWKDIYDSNQYYEQAINQLIRLRQLYGIHSESKLFIDKAQQGAGYAAYIQGTKGELAVKIGPEAWQPSGQKWNSSQHLLISGESFAVWGDRGWFKS